MVIMKENKAKGGIALLMIFLVLSGGILLSACYEEKNICEISPDCLDLKLMLQLPEQVEVSTRVTGNEQALRGYTITDVRVFQFPDNGSAMKMGYYSAATDSWAEQKDGLLLVQTGSDDFNDESCSFYIVVNAGDKLAGVTDKAGLEAAELPLANFSTDLSTIEPAVFSYGPVPYTKIEGSTSKPVALLAKLVRMYARLTVNYTTASGITINSARIEGVPSKLYPFPTTETTPTLSETYTMQEIPTSGITSPFSLYLPENLRGNGIATTEEGKNLSQNGPSTSSTSARSLDNCTCVVLKGTHDYYPDDANSDPIGVEYRFYLGSDMIRNYDVERGKHYTLTVNLKGANSADARVEITDGNVFTILNPDEVEYPDIEF